MTDTVNWIEFDELRSNVAAIKETDERLDSLEVGQRGLQDELHYVKDGVDAIKDHFGI